MSDAFDEAAAREQFSHNKAHIIEYMISAARWQHAKDRAEIESLRAQVALLREALQKIRFDRGTNAGSTNAANFTIAAEALAEANALAKGRAE